MRCACGPRVDLNMYKWKTEASSTRSSAKEGGARQRKAQGWENTGILGNREAVRFRRPLGAREGCNGTETAGSSGVSDSRPGKLALLVSSGEPGKVTEQKRALGRIALSEN